MASTMTQKQILDALSKKKYPPVCLLMGEEGYNIDVITNYIEDNVVDPTMKDFDMKVVYGKDVDLTTVVSMAKQYPMLSPIHLVIVKEAQDLKGLKGSSRSKDDADDEGADKEKDSSAKKIFLEYLKQPSPTTMLVLCYRNGSLPATNSIHKAISSVGWVFESKKVYENQVSDWLTNEVASHGFSITNGAVAMMVSSIGVELSRLANELSKLYPLLKQGDSIDEKLVEQQIGISREYNVFELQKAIGRRDIVLSNRIVNYFAANPKKNPLPMIIPQLYSYFVKIMFYHQVPDKKEAAKVMGVNPYFLRDYEQAARNFSLQQLAKCISFLYQADLKSKGVGRSNELEDGEILRETLFMILHC